MFKIFYLLY
ncbi:hypothetical protein ACTFIV_010243 [Dictyostelium citrinum]